MASTTVNDNKQSELIAEFAGITGVDNDRSKFYLESAGWDIQLAMESYYNHADSRSPSPVIVSTNENLDEDVQIVSEQRPRPIPSNSQQTNIPTWPPAQVQSKPKFATLGTLKADKPTKNNDESDSDSGNESPAGGKKKNDRQAFYVGGGGQQVLGPRKTDAKDVVDKVFKEAKAHGAIDANEAKQASSSSTNNSAFFGVGHRLDGVGAAVQSSAPSQPQVVSVHITMYRDGFTVDDSPLRAYDDAESKRFLGAIMKRQIPHELTQKHKGAEIDLHMENRQTEEYVPPKVAAKAFSGAGHMLGSPTPNVVSALNIAAPQPTSTSNNGYTPDIDRSLPVCRIQIRTLGGQRIVQEFNNNHTLANVRTFVDARNPSIVPYLFANGGVVPADKIRDEQQTLETAGVLNGILVQMKF